MAYTITRYQLTNDPQGRFPFQLNNNTVDNTHTTLNLLGQGVTPYGQYTADDLVWMLENFAGPNNPSNPITGQEWYNTTDQNMKVYNGTSWVNVGPYPNDNNIMTNTVVDGNNILPVIVNGTTMAIWSGTTFTPSPPIAGFPIIRAGLNLNETMGPLPVFYGVNVNPFGGSAIVIYLAAAGYSYVSGDSGKVYIRSNSGGAMSDVLPNPTISGFGNGWTVVIINDDPSASLTVTSASGTIDGGSNIVLASKNGVTFYTDGTNWFSARGTSTSNSVTSIATGAGLTGGPITSTGTIALATVADGTVLANNSGSTAAPSAVSTLRLGVSGSVLGTLTLAGSISGAVTILPNSTAGIYNFNLPTTAGTAGYFLTSAGGGSSPMTWTQSTSDIPSGTVIGSFLQATAPTGWTQVTTWNDQVLRVIGSAGTGGTTGGNWAISGCTVGNTSITQAQLPNVNFIVTDPSHTHGVTDAGHDHNLGGSTGSSPYGTPSEAGAITGGFITATAMTGVSINSATTGITVNSGGSGATHTHTFTADGTWRPSYVNALAASKN